MRILAADDSPVYREMLKNMLGRWGYDVVVANDGVEAWQVLRGDAPPHLAILDWMMPGMDGLEVCRAVREQQQQKTHYTYIILITAKSDSADLVAGMEAGADDYLTKPLNPRELKLRLRAGFRVLDSEERYRTIAETASDGIVTIDHDGRIRFCNGAFARTFGYCRKELLNCEFQMVVPRYESHLPPSDGPPRKPQATVEPPPWPVVELGGKDSRGRVLPLEISFSRFITGEGAWVTAVVRDVSESRAARRKIRTMNESLHTLSGRLLRLQDEERRRIARELHDSTGQALVALSMNLSLLIGPSCSLEQRARAIVSQSISLADQCSRDVRAVSYLLHPPLLDELGLFVALRTYIEGFSERTGIQVNTRYLSNGDRLPAELETTLFRIVQEGLANVHRHSGSRTAAIRLERKSGQVRLELKDDGKGMPAGLLDGPLGGLEHLGVGIQGMKERARQLGGTLKIRSGPGRGTRVSVRLPLDRDCSAARPEIPTV
jgi:PAS domain S-box-containing protein